MLLKETFFYLGGKKNFRKSSEKGPQKNERFAQITSYIWTYIIFCTGLFAFLNGCVDYFDFEINTSWNFYPVFDLFFDQLEQCWGSGGFIIGQSIKYTRGLR